MYNATANNDYDSYPTPEEYKKMMEKTGQKNYAYAGGEFIKGIPMRSQMPVYNTLNGNNFKRKYLTIINDNNNFIGTNTNNNFHSKHSSVEKDREKIMNGGISKRTYSYFKTENNYTNNKRGKFNITRVPEPIN